LNRSVVQTLLFRVPADVKRAGIKTGSPEIKLKLMENVLQGLSLR